ncbi:MAG TPA: adenylate/guanylate cyclase domain-containing protein [Casimicrobiaceae bacterium]|nr:adenylate/guanylate cyclase domain-containing protein [Casimicrobiaceae bacterium]
MDTRDSLRCTSCGTANRLPRRFCGQCGAPLPLACPRCAFANEADARFCGGCGDSLIRAAPLHAAPPAEAELRPVTVLFADICGFTRLSEAMLAEDVHALLQAVFAAADHAIERCGGRVDKHIGDAVMGVFGAPLARGDEPARAVAAAQAMIASVHERTGALGRALDLHVGIAAGEVVASGLGSDEHSAYTVIGPSVNLAARLVDRAGPGEIVVDDAVHADIAASSTCTALPDIAIKGLDRPVTAWRVHAFDATGSSEHAAPLVGRRHELAQLTGALRASVGTGTGSVFAIRGEPGIGKSRLVGELMDRARSEGFACHRGLVLDTGAARERDAIREIATGLLDLLPGSAAGLDALHAAIGRAQLTEAQAAALAGLLDLPLSSAERDLRSAMDASMRERATTDAIVALLSVAARRQPRVLVVEDIHWADEPTLRRVAALANAAATLPVLVVLTSRRDGDPLATSWRTALRGSLSSIDLGPLDDADARELCASLLPLSEQRMHQCVSRAAGNPLFLEQLLRAAHEHEDRLPASVHSLVLARVDRLPERERVALRAASIVGQRFPLELVRHLSGLPDYTCAALLAHHLVQTDGADFLFGHALIRDGIYASITHARRKALHAQAAEWYRERDAALCAEHLERCEAPEAARAYRRAAVEEHAALRLDRALALADRGAALARIPADVCALQLLRAELLKEIGDGKRAAAAAAAALAAASSSLEQCRALLGIAAGHRLTGEAAAALDALARAEALVNAESLAAERVVVHYLRGNVEFARGRYDECRAEHARAHAEARALGDAEHEARSLSGLGDADYAQGVIRSAFARFDACLALCEANGFAGIAIPNGVMRGHCRMYLGEAEEGLRDMRQAALTAARVGNRHAEMFALQSMGVRFTSFAQYAEAEPIQHRAVGLARELGARRYLPAMLAHQAESLWARGEIAEAQCQLQEALAIMRETGTGFAGAMVLGMLMRITDDPQARGALAAEAERALAHGCISHNHFYYRRYGIEDALARAHLEDALRHADALAAYTRREPLPYTDLLIERARACVRHARAPGDVDAMTDIARLKAQAEAWRWTLPWPA